MRAAWRLWVLILCGLCMPLVAQHHDRSGGDTTAFDDTRNAFSLPAANLADERRQAFFVGNSFFKHNWVIAAASTSARDGLGPLFNSRSCSGCHFKDGRGRPPEPGQPMSTMLLRISIPGIAPDGGPVPDPVYGDQIQGLAIPGVPAEAEVVVEYETVAGTYADGSPFALRRPRYTIRNPGYGALAESLLTSPRVAPAMIGLGLLEAVPERVILDRADPEDRDRDGISGRANWVPCRATQGVALGRFGWKAEQPTVHQQCAAAFQGDLGITSSMFPRENHTAAQSACSDHPSGGQPEVSDAILADVVLYASTLAVPARRQVRDPEVRFGQELFVRARCATCHVPEVVTGEAPGLPELSHQTIHPYTDLLLHDLGEELADHRPVFAAGGREWRTPPLWGIGLLHAVNGHTFLLHDGRARNLAEAILWHGGEATAAREAFRALSATERAALLAFLESL